MQISITKKLAAAMSIQPDAVTESANPLFSWTANWTNTFDKRKEDMVVMMNHATRFTVIIYGVKRDQFKDFDKKMIAAIRNTLLAINVNEQVIDEYLEQAGEISFFANHDRKLTTWINRKCIDASIVMGRIVHQSTEKIKYEDTLGYIISCKSIDFTNHSQESFCPCDRFLASLQALTGKPAYQYRAFELLITLDLEVYQATRRLIVPADLEFTRLHKIIQKVYKWENKHVFDFAVFAGENSAPVAILVCSEEALEYDEHAMRMKGRKLSEFMPENKFILYTYDMGDSWEHQIELVRVLENYDKATPYVMETIGQAPPEDVGGVGGFMDFREVMLDPSHPDYEQTRQWCGYWSPELSEWERRTRVLRF